MTQNLRSGLPAYHQLYVLWTEKIRTGQVAPFDRLPSEAKLVEQHKVSRVTVRRALDLLVNDGLVEKQKGRGTFVVPHKAPSQKRKKLSGVIANLISEGANLEVRNLNWEKINVSDRIAKKLDITPQSRCLFIQRLRRYNRKPVSLSSIYIPETIAALLDKSKAEGKLILECLDIEGYAPQSTEHALTATLASGRTAELLKLNSGAPLLEMQGVVFDEDGHPLYFQESVYHPDHYEYTVRLNRDLAFPGMKWRINI